MAEVMETGTGEDMELLSAMEELQRAQDRVTKLREQSREKAIADVIEKIRIYSLKPEEIGFGQAQVPHAASGKAVKPSSSQGGQRADKPDRAKDGLRIGRRADVQAKYQGPAGASQQWSGRGKPPKWMVPFLEAGAKKEDFLVKPVDAGNNKE